MKRILNRLKRFLLPVVLLIGVSFNAQKKSDFIHVNGQDLFLKNQKYFIRGTNLGNWLNPEGYMFLFKGASSYRLINEAFSEMVGPAFTARFWRAFQDNYVTKADIDYLASTGMNTIRIPFHYKMFTNQDYMGFNDPNRGFEILDRVIGWCKQAGLHVILDMHDAPGGQTGANIDDSYGFPWLFVDQSDRKLFVEIWERIAKHYANNPTVLGYDLLNEPIAPYFGADDEKFNKELQPLYIETTKAIRRFDKNHVIILSGAQWGGNTSVFTDWKFDDNLMFTIHRYQQKPDVSGIQDFLDFRKKTNLPLYMGETGENTDQWIASLRKTLDENNIGWTFWPYKKMESTSGIASIPVPKDWDTIRAFTAKDNHTFGELYKSRPDQEIVRAALTRLLVNIKFRNNKINEGYVKALGLKP